jgi:hypothetical protein
MRGADFAAIPSLQHCLALKAAACLAKLAGDLSAPAEGKRVTPVHAPAEGWFTNILSMEPRWFVAVVGLPFPGSA